MLVRPPGHLGSVVGCALATRPVVCVRLFLHRACAIPILVITPTTGARRRIAVIPSRMVYSISAVLSGRKRRYGGVTTVLGKKPSTGDVAGA